MPVSEPGPDGALGREVERTVRRLVEVETLVRQLAADVAALGEVMADPGPDTVATRSWLLVADPGQAVADLRDLRGWVSAVFLRYPDALLTSCWLWHPAVIEELWWLRHAHREAYDPRDGSWTRAGDWHDRQRPGVSKRVAGELQACDLTRHSADRPGPVLPLATSADRLAEAWATHRVSPKLTEHEQTEAEEHERQAARTNHR